MTGPDPATDAFRATQDDDGHDDAGRAVSREVAMAQVEPGPGYTARSGDMVLWAEQAPGPQGTEALDAAILGFSDIAARSLISGQAMARISNLLSDARIASLAGLAAVVPTASGMLSIAAGWGTVTNGADITQRSQDGGGSASTVGANGADTSEESEVRASGGATIRMTQLNHELLIVGRQDVAARLAGVGVGSQPSTVGLIHGVVPGGAVQVATRLTIGSSTGETIVTQAPPSPRDSGAASPPPPPPPAQAPPPPPPPPPDANQTAEQDIEVLSFRDASGGGYAEGLPLDPGPRAADPTAQTAARPQPDRPPGPDDASTVIIEGILCARGHLNDPLALNCGTCGVSMIKHSGSRVEGVRPPLGIVVLDDGATYALGCTLVIGTAPNQAEAVRDGRARGVPLTDHSGQIEPLHAEVRLDGWQVALIDWSTHGTYILPQDAKTWQAAPRGAPVHIAPGTRIALGGRTATFT